MQNANMKPFGRILFPFVVSAVAIVAVYFVVPTMSTRMLTLSIAAVIFSVSILGLGVVTGSAGMISLCQLTFAAVGAWVVSGLNFIDKGGVPTPDGAGAFTVILWLILGGVAAGIVGIIIGLPALRLRGVNLAVVTLGFATAVNFTLVMIQFPGLKEGILVPRPTPPFDDESFLIFCVAVLAVCATVVYFLQGGRWGASWKSVAFSERGTASVGGSVVKAKLTAFAVSAVLGGVGGGLLVMKAGQTLASSYLPISSLALYVLSIISGAQFIDMAILGGILWVAVPALLEATSISKDWAFVIFGAASIQALTSGATPGGMVRSFWWNRQMKKRQQRGQARAVASVTPVEVPARASTVSGGPLLVTDGLTVEFGTIKALDGVSMTVHENSIMGLIGPNGAGKSTFVDAISGFLPDHTGTVSLGGRGLAGMSPTKRARNGLRRTFQQDRVPPSLTIEAYVKYVARRRVTAAEIEETLAFFGCPQAKTRLVGVDVGTRRLVEVAANVLARPRLLLLDEPAAGLSYDEHVELGNAIRQIPERFGMAVVLIEHDLELVRTVCDELTVLDFGKVIASGFHEEVLANPDVMKAYMGETEAA